MADSTTYVPSSISDQGVSMDSLYLLKSDTQQRFNNVLSDVKQPIKYSIPDYSPDISGLLQSALLRPEVSKGSIQGGIWSDDPQQRDMALAAFNRSFQRDPVHMGVGVPETFDYNKSMEKYLNSDFGYNPYVGEAANEQFNYENDWANKSIWNRGAATVLKTLGRFIGSTGTKLVQTFGLMGSMVGNGIQEIFDPSGNNAMADIADNGLSRWAQNMEEVMKNSNRFAVFKPQGWEDKGFFQKLGHGAFWSDEVADGAAFMGEMVLSSYMLGGILGKVPGLSKLGNMTINTASKLGAPGKVLDFGIRALTGATDISGVGRWAFLTASESGMEASSKYQQMKEELEAARDAGDPDFVNMSDEEIRAKAGDAAASTFRDNMAILAISNAFENKMIYGPLLSKVKKATGRSVGDINISRSTRSTEELARATRSNLSRTKLSIAGFYGSRILGATAFEGLWEENAQLAAERLSTYEDYRNLGFLDKKGELVQQAWRQTKGAMKGTDPEAGTSIGLGALIGGGAVTGISKFSGERRRTAASINNVIKSYEQQRREFLSFNEVYDKDADGSLVVNEEKALAKLEGLVNFTNKQQAIEAIANPLVKRKLQNEALINYIYASKAAGVFDKVINRLSNLNRVTPDQIMELGFDPATTTDPQSVIDFSKKLAKFYDETFVGQPQIPQDATEEQAKEIYTKDQDRKFKIFESKARAANAQIIADEYMADYITEKEKPSVFSPEVVAETLDVQQYNSLMYQINSLNKLKDTLSDTSKFYDEYIDLEMKRILQELKNLAPIIDAKLNPYEDSEELLEDKANRPAMPTPSIVRDPKSGLLISSAKYEGKPELKTKTLDPFVKGIGDIDHDIDQYAQFQHANMTIEATKNKWLAEKFQNSETAIDEYKTYLEAVKSKDEKQDAKETPVTPVEPTPTETPEAPVVVPEESAKVTEESLVPEVEIPTTYGGQNSRLRDMMLAYNRDDLDTYNSVKQEAKNYPPENVMKVLINWSKNQSYPKAAGHALAAAAEIVGQEFFDNYMNNIQQPASQPEVVVEETKTAVEEPPIKDSSVQGEVIIATTEAEKELEKLLGDRAEEVKKQVIEFIDNELVPVSYRVVGRANPLSLLKEIAEQASTIDSKGVDMREQTVATFGEEIVSYAESIMGTTATSENTAGSNTSITVQTPEEAPEVPPQAPVITPETPAVLKQDPQPLNEIPPEPPSGENITLLGTTAPLNTNIIDYLVDTAKTNGRFVFDTVNPKNIVMSAARPVDEDGRIPLKTRDDKNALRNFRIMEMLGQWSLEDPTSDTYQIKLELLTDENKDWFYQRDEKSSNVIAVLVDRNGRYHYFDDEGNPADESFGRPFGIEYEDNYYQPENLNLSRDRIAGIGTSIQSNYSVDNPLLTIYKLLHNGVPIYGSIRAVTAGTLLTFNNTNTFNTKARPGETYKMRTLQEMIDNGDIQPQFLDVRVSGFYIDNDPSNPTEQRTKIGRPYIYDIKSGIYIPLQGRKLKDVTFSGTPFNKDSQLYEIIDILDKKGRLNVDDAREDGTRIVQSQDDFEQLAIFLRTLLYNKEFRVGVSPDRGTIYVHRNNDAVKVGSIWDARINYVKLDPTTSFVGIPYSTDESGETATMSYPDFLNENFETGAAKGIITDNDVRFTKVNKRLVFELNEDHNQLVAKIGKEVETVNAIVGTPEVGQYYARQKDLSKRYIAISIDEDSNIITLGGEETEDEVEVRLKDFSKTWVKIDKIERPEPVKLTDKQKEVVSKIKSIPKVASRTKLFKYTVTGLIRPGSKKMEGNSPATVMGNVIDYIAKNIFLGNKVAFTDVIKIKNVKGPLSAYFDGELHFNKVKEIITATKEKLEREGYTFMTDVIVYDKDASVSGEIDLLMIDPEGKVTVSDFKSSRNEFDDIHMATDWGSGVTEREYFATQGYLYGLILKNMTGVDLADTNEIIGLPISYTTPNVEDPYSSKLNRIKEKDDYIVRFPKTSIAKHYIGMTSMKDIVKRYEDLSNQNATTPSENITKITKRKKTGGSLDMTIRDINKLAASNEELKAEIAHMSEMFGEEFVVRFANNINTEKYGDWTSKGVTLYRNAIAGTVYHEGWHQFSQFFLTSEEKIDLYESIRSQAIDYTDRGGLKRNTSQDTDLDIEEMLADEWVKYVKSPYQYRFPKARTKGILGFFKNLWRFIKEYFSGTKNPNTLFKDLYNGNLKNYKKDINNAIWGNLQSAILNEAGDEILNHSRSALYVQTTSYFVGKILRDNKLSFSWLRENLKGSKMKTLVRDEFFDLQDSIAAKLGLPEGGGLDMLFTDPEGVINLSMAQMGLTREVASKYVGHIGEIENILDEGETTRGFDSFYNYYIRNSDIDTIREASERPENNIDVLDNDSIKSVEEELDEFLDAEELLNIEDDESGVIDASGEAYNKGPNDKAAFIKASKEVQDFFRTMPVVLEVDPAGNISYQLNELGIPETYEYSSVFNKAKTLLEGRFTIEDILTRLDRFANPDLHKSFPQAKFIVDQLREYMDRPTPENFSFIRKFVKVMSLPEVDNKQLTVNFDAIEDKVKGQEKSVVKMKSQSRSGEMQEISQWQYLFTVPTENRPYTTLSDSSTLDQLFNSTDISNILYNVDGVITLNPFFNYNTLDRLGDKQFLELMGIKLYENFWSDMDAVPFAARLRSYFETNLRNYAIYSSNELIRFLVDMKLELENVEDFRNSTLPNRELVAELINKFFLNNAIQQFRERRTYKLSDGKTIETFSLYPAMEDVSRMNSIYSPYAASRSFTDGSGKLKWPFYEPSLITYRTRLLNDIVNIKQFNDNLEFTSINPNTAPWMKNTLFYQSLFDDRGNKKTLSGDITNREGNPLTRETVKIEVADLSSYQFIKGGRYNTVHPKTLNGPDKLFFDTVTLLTDGRIEIPRAATSSTVMSIKLNSYGAVQQGTSYVTNNLPIAISNSSIFTNPRFRTIMRNYLVGEVQKMAWYNNRNSSHELANRFNIFEDILSPELKNEILEFVKTKNPKPDSGSIPDFITKKSDEFNRDLKNFFDTYANELYNGKENASYMGMSETQRRVLENLLNLSQDKSKSTAKSDVERERGEIADVLERTGGTSALRGAREKATSRISNSMRIVASTFAANQFILNIEYHNWYMGDNFLFNNPFKRGNLTTNTGTLGIASEHTNSMLNRMRGETLNSLFTGNRAPKDFRILKTHVIKEIETKSKSFDIMINDITNYELQFGTLDLDRLSDRKEQLTKEFDAYSKIKVADGQAMINLDSYRTMRIIYGNWSNKDEKEYRRQIAITRLRKNLYFRMDGDVRVALTGDALEKAKSDDRRFIKDGPYSEFNPQKFAYTGPELIVENGKVVPSPIRTKFDKMSLHPVMPEYVIGSGLPGEKLMIDMAVNDIDYVKMQSAAKGVAHEGVVEYFDNDGGAIPNLTLEDDKAENLLSTYLKHQLSTDGMKVENTFGSQQRVMFFDVKYQPEVQNNPRILREIEDLERAYLNSVGNVMRFQRAQFFNRFGLEESGEGQTYEIKVTDNERFAAAINSVAKKQNFPTNMMEYLKYNPSDQTYTYDPSLLFNRKALIDSIGGMIDAELRRLKTKGTAAIQVTSLGNSYHKYTNPTVDDIKKYGTNGLHYYHYKYDSKGRIIGTSTMGIKLTLQGDFKNLLNLKWKGSKIGTLERLNEALKDETWKNQHINKLTFIGYRIPTNNNNFIDHLEIMEFLPASVGNIIIAPPEHMIKSGSDFDVDKLNLIFPSISNNGELVELPSMSIEEVYTALNKKTSSIRDYKEEQKVVNDMIKTGKKDLKRVNEKIKTLEQFIRNAFFNIDSSKYTRMELRGSSFGEMIEEFRLDLVDYENTSNYVELYERAISKLNIDLALGEVQADQEFRNLLLDLSRYKDYYTNEMLQSQKKTLQHPAYLRMMISPSNTDYLLAAADRIAELTNRSTSDNRTSTSNMKYTTVNTKSKEYLGDSKDLGLYSIQRRWFSLLNYSKMELNRDWRYGGAASKMRIHTPLAKHEDRERIGTDEVIRIHGENLDGMAVKDIWDQLMSLTIDLPSNTKYTLFGINKANRKLVQYLILSRYKFDDIINFINQPILQEVYSLLEKNSKKWPNYSLKTAMIDVSYSYKFGGTFERLYDENYEVDEDRNRLGGNVFVENPGIYAKEIINEDTYFDPEVMKSDIQATTKDQAFRERQKKILAYFMEANLEASNFTTMQFVYSEDRNKNTNYFTLLENDTNKNKIRGNEYDNLPVEGSMFSKDALALLEKDSIYSHFTYSRVAKLFYEKFGRRFTEPYISTGIQRLLGQTNTFGIDKQLLATKIEGDFVEFVYKNFGKFDIDIYDPFTDTITRSNTDFNTHFISRIYDTGIIENYQSYGNKLEKLLQNYPELRSIPFVQKLYGDVVPARNRKDESVLNSFDMYTGSAIRFRRSQDNTVAERNHYIKELESLINYNPGDFMITKQYSPEDIRKISAFFTELSYLTLYQAGPTNIADNFSDLLPADMWQQFVIGAFENYENYTANSPSLKSNVVKMFMILYTENNPKVPWKGTQTYYNLAYYGRDLTDKKERQLARRYRAETKFFLNFRAGKMYDLNIIAKELDFKGLPEIKC